MEFKGRYLFAMRAQAPKMFVALCRSGQLERHVQEKGVEARALLDELLAGEPKGIDGLPKDLQALRLAEECVLAQMLDFPRTTGPENLDRSGRVGRTASTVSTVHLRVVK